MAIAIVGAGLSGAVIGNELARAGLRCEIFEARAHVAGNCHTSRDAETNVLVHEYGPHIFNTNNELVWDYVNRLTNFVPFTNRVKAVTGGRVFSLPINLLTINQFFGKTLNPAEAKEFIDALGVKTIVDPETFEDQALRFLGRDLYEAFFLKYAVKQWGMHPKELPASILKRLPVRFNYDDNYYNKKFQGIPSEGYTDLVEKLLDHPNLSVHLNQLFSRGEARRFDHVFYSGPIDAWFDFQLGRLRYRTLDFEREVHDGDFQGNAVVNYCDQSVPWTRITEHKHFAPHEEHAKTVVFKEYSRECQDGDTPYYPVRLVRDKALLEQYVALANNEERVAFVGRLGTYRYIDMDLAIAEALQTASEYNRCLTNSHQPASFIKNPLELA